MESVTFLLKKLHINFAEHSLSEVDSLGLNEGVYLVFMSQCELADIKKVNIALSPDQIVLVSANWQQLDKLKDLSNINIILGTDAHNNLRIEEIKMAVERIFSKSIFGLENYVLHPDFVKSETIEHPIAKESTLNKMFSDAKNSGISERKLKNLEICAQELINNAFYHGDATLRENWQNLENAKAQKSVTFSWAVNRIFFGISILDGFGLLTRERYFQCLKERMEKKEIKIQNQGQSLGMGFYISFKTLHNQVINVQKNLQTEVIGLVNLSLTRKDLKDYYNTKSVFYFSD